MTSDLVILAIETSQVGSISLLKGSEEIDSWTGGKENSRSQDLLPEISNLLVKNNIDKSQIGLIAAATGPGSFTGLRVGISIAIGLSQSLGCARVGIPTLNAMALTEPESDLICVVPAGKEQCYWQAFERTKAAGEIHLSTYDNLYAEVAKRPATKLVSEFHILNKLQEIFTETKVIPAPENLARLIGLLALANYNSNDNKSEITPLYIREATVRL